MIPITEFQLRSLHGPVMQEQKFDLTYSQKVRQIVAKYDIKYNAEEIIVDDATADKVFQAGVELLAEVGLYNRDTYRVIQFSKEEIEQVAQEGREGPHAETFGKGKDRVAIQARTSEDPRHYVFFCRPGTIAPAELNIPYLQSAAQEELVQGMIAVGITSYNGLENRANTPGEVICSLVDIRDRLEVARRVGKPNMFIGMSGAITPGAVMAGYQAGYQDRFNSVIAIHLMPELKLTWSRLSLACCAQEWGIVPWTSAMSILGALSRGPEDSAVTIIANLLGQLGYGHGTIGALSAFGLDGGTSAAPPMWAVSAAARAAERHIRIPIGVTSPSEAGAGTEMALYEKAAQAVTQICSGAAFSFSQASRNGRVMLNGAGLESRLTAETAHAMAGTKRAKANAMGKKILALYQDQLGKSPEGKTFPELYDLKTLKPVSEYMAVYERAKEKLAQLGVPYQ